MFSSKGTYPPVGLFSTTHIISVIICFVLIAILAFISRGMGRDRYFKCLRLFTIIFTVLEIFKICWNLSRGYTNVDSWLPLYFCSLFIYALWFTWSSNKFIREIGLSYIAMACIIAGAIFVIFPTTSFSSYPIFHFQCIYSMVYHSAMIYSGYMLFKTKAVEVDFKLVLKYFLFCAMFMALGLIVNWTFNGNMMFLSNPYRIPIQLLSTIYGFSSVMYTLIIIVAHLLMGPFIWSINVLCEKLFVREIPIYAETSIIIDEDEMREKEI